MVITTSRNTRQINGVNVTPAELKRVTGQLAIFVRMGIASVTRTTKNGQITKRKYTLDDASMSIRSIDGKSYMAW